MENVHLPTIWEDQNLEEEEEEEEEEAGNVSPQNHNENGNNALHHQQPLQNHQHPLRIRFEYSIDRMPYSFWPFDPQHQEDNFPIDQPHQEPVQDQPPGFLQNDGHILNDPPQDEEPVMQVQPPILQDVENGNILNDQPQDQEPVRDVQPPDPQDDEFLHDENSYGISMSELEEPLQELIHQEEDGNFNPNDEPQDQESGVLQEQPLRQENGENIHNQNDDIPPPSPELQISLFEISHLPNWPQPVREGQVPPIFCLAMPQNPVSFLIHRKYGQPGPYSTDIVTVIPLDVCNSYEDFYANAWVSFQSAVGVASSNQPDENHPIPGYHLLYFFQQPAEHVSSVVGIPWEQFRNRITVFRAYEYL